MWSWGYGPQLGLGELQHALVPRQVECLKGRTAIAICCGDSHSLVLLKKISGSSRNTTPAPTVEANVPQNKIKEDQHYPSRCATCDKDIYTFTDTKDMCIVDTYHECSKTDDKGVNDESFTEDEHLSNMSIPGNSDNITSGDGGDEVDNDMEISENIEKTDIREELDVSNTLETSGIDSSMLVLTIEDPFEKERIEEEIEKTDEPEKEINFSEKMPTTNEEEAQLLDEQTKSLDSTEDVWQLQLPIQSPKSKQGSSLSSIDQTEAMSYLQRQFCDNENDEKEFSETTGLNATKKTSDSKALPSFDEKLPKIIEDKPLQVNDVKQQEAMENKELQIDNDRFADYTMQKSGTILEWSKEITHSVSNPEDVRKSLRTIHMQQRNLSQSSMSINEAEASSAFFKPPITSTEVWVWGCNDNNQLGVGDTLDRNEPVHLRSLAGFHVIKLAAGKTHSLALTANSHIYSWGSNAYGQLGHKDQAYTPKRLRIKGATVWDIAAGSDHSIFLGDSCVEKSDVFYCGKQPNPEKYSSVQKTNVPKPIGALDSIGRMVNITSGGYSCACQVINLTTPEVNTIFEFATTERSFYAHLAKTTNILLRPLQKSSFYSSMDVFPFKSSLNELVSTFLV